RPLPQGRAAVRRRRRALPDPAPGRTGGPPRADQPARAPRYSAGDSTQHPRSRRRRGATCGQRDGGGDGASSRRPCPLRGRKVGGGHRISPELDTADHHMKSPKNLAAALVAVAALVLAGAASADPIRYGIADDWPKFHPCGDVWWSAVRDIGFQDLRMTLQW